MGKELPDGTATTDTGRPLVPSRYALHGVLNNTFWLFLSWGLRVVLGLVVGVAVARHLGPAEFGEYAYLLSILSVFQTVTTLGMDSLVIRDLSSQPDRAHAIIGTVWRARLAAGFVAWTACVGLVAVFKGDGNSTVPLMMLLGGALVFQSAEIVDLWFQSQLQSRRTVLSRLAAQISINALRIALLLNGAPLSAFVATVVAEAAVLAAALCLSYRRFPAPGKLLWEPALVWRLLRQSWPLMLSSLSVTIYMRIDQVMLKNLASVDQLGIFSAATTLSQSWLFLPTIAFSSLVPSLSRWHAQDQRLFFERLQLIYTGAVLVSIPAVGIGMAFASEIVNLLYGPAFSDAAGPLKLHIPSTIFMALGLVQAMWIFRPNRNWVTLAQTLAGACVSIGINLLLIPKYGALGAAFSALLAQVASSFLINAALDPAVFRMQVRALLLLDLPNLIRTTRSFRRA